MIQSPPSTLLSFICGVPARLFCNGQSLTTRFGPAKAGLRMDGKADQHGDTVGIGGKQLSSGIDRGAEAISASSSMSSSR